MGRSRLILAAVLMLVATSLPPPSGAAPVTHGAVYIQSDADFTAANGVVSGSGTPGDPFVFEGWHFVTSIGTAVIIRNTTASFVFRNNSFDATNGISIGDSNGTIAILRNRFVFHTTGVAVAHATAQVVGNTFIGDSTSAGAGKGVSLESSDSRVDANMFLYVQFAVLAQRGSPTIRCNDMHDDVIIAGVTVKFTSNATIECNIMTRCNAGIEAESTIGTIVVNNSIDDCGVGIHVHLDKDLIAVNNTVRASWSDGVRIDTTSGVFAGNVIVDGAADGVLIYRSPILFANNTVSNNLDVGVIVSQTSGADLSANLVSHNSVGIALQGGAAPLLTANVMTNNTVGIDIPYASRQAIVNLSANLVNGVNIDGTLTASERVYYYHAANVTITGGVRDSGFSAGYYGSLTAQGNVVLYEVDTANIDATLIGHATYGVFAINSFNVVVDGSLIVQTGVGVYAAAVPTNQTGGVPPCAVAVKNTNVTVPVDPIGTIGVDVHACLGIVRNSTLSLVDVGIRFDQASRGTVEGNVVTNTSIGLDMSGALPVVVTGNVATDNSIGARFTASRANVTGNTFARNANAGVQLYSDSKLAFRQNLVSSNGRGVVDMQDCSARTPSGGAACSSLASQDNVVASNQGVGVELHGASTFRGDAFVKNGAAGARLAAATLTRVNASANGDVGARIVGDFTVRDSQFVGNARHGLDAAGGGELRRSNFTSNGEAGIHLRATYVQAFDINVSHNFDGILFDEDPAALVALPPPSTIGLNWILGLSPTDGNGPDPLDLHRSILVGNERDAIRAGGAALVNATSNYWGGDAPAISVKDQVGAFRNGVSPTVRFVPWYADEAMTMSEPVPLL